LRFLLNPSGSAGDVHPHVAVGIELKKRGHEVFVLTNELYRDVAEKNGLRFVPIGEPVQWKDIRGHRQIHRKQTAWREAMRWGAIGTMLPSYHAIHDLYVPEKTIVTAPAWSLGARIAREKLDIRLATFVMNPFLLRSTIRSPITPGMFMPAWMPRWIKATQYWFGDTFFVEPLIGKDINAFRQSLGLKPVRRYMNGWWFSPDCVLALFDQAYVPPQLDWPCQVEFVGHTLWDPIGADSVNDQVRAFLEAGSPPICFVPGSVGPGDEQYYSIAVDICRSNGERGLILDKADPDQFQGLPDSVKQFPYSPLAHVLPRCKAILHSGCMGTIAQALRAGLPQIIRPRVNDQPDLAQRMEQLGVAKRISVGNFNQAGQAASLVTKVLCDAPLIERCKFVQRQLDCIPSAPRIADRLEAVASNSSRVDEARCG
jgi:UDP:flavonoid glycosyltransferase YjiC (YdhE family)